MKRKPEELTVADRKKTLELLFTAAKDAHANNATQKFLEGLLTHSEQIMLGRRIWIARLLIEGATYQDIGEQLHVGPNTVMRTELWLQGLLPDYEKILRKQEAEQTLKARKREAKINPFGFTALKMKYPLHFLLFPWPKL